jgi:hypothetical protein
VVQLTCVTGRPQVYHLIPAFQGRVQGRERERAERGGVTALASMTSSSTTPGEIITLQFGAAANYAGAHWWNLQVWRE